MSNEIDGVFNPIICSYIDLFLKGVKYFREDYPSGNYRILYRGQPDVSRPIQPSVFRKNNLQKETQIIRELKRIAPHEFSMCPSQIECLIKMQHYGLPTRLLDVTLNPLVALYFACSKDASKDGAVFIFTEYVHTHDEAIIERNASLSSFAGSSPEALLKHINADKSVFLSLINADDTKIREVIKRLFGEKYHAVMPPLNNERIRRQQGAFLLFGLDIEKQNNPCQKESFSIEKLRSNDEDILISGIKINHENKSAILRDLDALGINKAFLFPELDYQTSYIKETLLGLENENKEENNN